MPKEERDVSEALVRELANPTNRTILSLLAVEASYPRRISDLTGIGETDVARRLRRMEGLGLVRSEWKHIGKNVKAYELVVSAVTVGFSAEGLQVELHGVDGETTTAPIDHLDTPLPVSDGFVGRDTEMRVLGEPGVTAVVEGLPGIGKSALLAAFIDSVKDDRPVFFHACRGTESLTWLCNRLGAFVARTGDRTLIDALDAGLPEPERARAMLDALDTEHLVVVLDDVHTLEDDTVRAFVRDAIETPNAATLVVSGRARPLYDPTVKHVRHLRLEGLDDTASAELLARHDIAVPAELGPRLRDEVGGHPLAIHLLVETARTLEVEVEELLDRVPERDLETYLLGEVYEHLSQRERELLAHASVFRTTFDEDALARVTGRDPAGALFKLRKRRLVEETEDGYFLHEILRNFFYHHLQDRATFHTRAAEHHLSQATIEDRLEAMHHLLEAGDRAQVLRLIERDIDLRQFDAIDSGYHNLYLTILDELRQGRLDDHQRGIIEDETADIHHHRGEHERALQHYEAADEHMRAAGDDDRLADNHWKRGLCLAALGKEGEAREIVARGLEREPDERTLARLEELQGELGGG